MEDIYYNTQNGPKRNYYINELNETSIKFNGNIDSKIILKEHQLALLQKCRDFENNRFIHISHSDVSADYENIQTQYGIIADKTGSGKSYVILSLILLQKSLDIEFRTVSYLGNYVTLKKKETFNTCSCNIIVVPHSIKIQWVNYIKNFSDKMTYYLIDSKKSFDEVVKEWDIKYKFYSVLLITGSFYRYLEQFINDKKTKVSRVIFDEADTCNVPSCKKIEAQFYWFVTASYKNIVYPYSCESWNRVTRTRDYLTNGIENNKFIKEIFKINLHYTNQVLFRKIFDSLIIKNTDEYVDQSYKLPDIVYTTIICKEPSYLHILNGIVSDQILHFLHAGDVQGAMQCVNKINVNTEENIINKILEDYNNKIHNINCSISCANQFTYQVENDRIEKLNKLESEKKIFTEKLTLLNDRLNDSNECIICYEPISVKTITKCCNSSYCLQCISKWLENNNKCPLCKKDINFDSLYYVSNKEEKEEENIIVDVNSETYDFSKYSKYENLIYLLENKDKNSKFLICSDYDNTFIEIEEKLKNKNIKYEKVKGNNVRNTIDRYKNSDLNILLVNSKHYGSGMNLENTTDIVLFHKLDSEIEKQVIGRAHRMGRTCSLKVHYLLHKSEQNLNNIIT